MPPELDPEWEYYAGDPEVEELLEGNRKRDRCSGEPCLPYGFMSYEMRVCKVRTRNNGRMTVEGMQYVKQAYAGKVPFRVMAETLGVSEETVRQALVGMRIKADRRPPIKAKHTVCKWCNGPLTRARSAQKFCTPSCSAKHREASPRYRRRLEFARMWKAGVPRWEIETKLGMVEHTVNKWRREMGLLPRRSLKEEASECS